MTPDGKTARGRVRVADAGGQAKRRQPADRERSGQRRSAYYATQCSDCFSWAQPSHPTGKESGVPANPEEGWQRQGSGEQQQPR